MRSSSELGTGAATSLRSMSCRARTSPVSSSIFLILDPFVRLHRIDENASGEVAPLLAYLRELQRQHSLAVLVVHHAKKGAGNVRAGQALRGSSEWTATSICAGTETPSSSRSSTAPPRRCPVPHALRRAANAASAQRQSMSGLPL